MVRDHSEHDRSNDTNRVTRRHALVGLGAVTLSGLAGCAGSTEHPIQDAIHAVHNHRSADGEITAEPVITGWDDTAPPEPGGSFAAMTTAYNPHTFEMRVVATGGVRGPHGVMLTQTKSTMTKILEPEDTDPLGFSFQMPNEAPPGEYEIVISVTTTIDGKLSGDPSDDAFIIDQAQKTQTFQFKNGGHSGPLPPAVRMLADGLVNGVENFVEHVEDFYNNPFAGLLGTAYGIYEGVLTIIDEATAILTNFWGYLRDTIKGLVALVTNAPWDILNALFKQFLSKAKDHVPSLYDRERTDAYIVGFILGLLVFKLLKWYISKRVDVGSLPDMETGMQKLVDNPSKFSKFTDSLPDGNGVDAKVSHLKLRLSRRYSFSDAGSVLDEIRSTESLTPAKVSDAVRDLRFLQRFDPRSGVQLAGTNGLLAEALYYRHIAASGAKSVDFDMSNKEFVVPDETGRYVINGLEVDGPGELDEVVVRVDASGEKHVEKVAGVTISKNRDLETAKTKLEDNLQYAADYGVKANIPQEKFADAAIEREYVGPKGSGYPIQLLYRNEFFVDLWEKFRWKVLSSKTKSEAAAVVRAMLGNGRSDHGDSWQPAWLRPA